MSTQVTGNRPKGRFPVILLCSALIIQFDLQLTICHFSNCAVGIEFVFIGLRTTIFVLAGYRKIFVLSTHKSQKSKYTAILATIIICNIEKVEIYRGVDVGAVCNLLLHGPEMDVMFPLLQLKDQLSVQDSIVSLQCVKYPFLSYVCSQEICSSEFSSTIFVAYPAEFRVQV